MLEAAGRFRLQSSKPPLCTCRASPSSSSSLTLTSLAGSCSCTDDHHHVWYYAHFWHLHINLPRTNVGMYLNYGGHFGDLSNATIITAGTKVTSSRVRAHTPFFCVYRAEGVRHEGEYYNSSAPSWRNPGSHACARQKAGADMCMGPRVRPSAIGMMEGRRRRGSRRRRRITASVHPSGMPSPRSVAPAANWSLSASEGSIWSGLQATTSSQETRGRHRHAWPRAHHPRSHLLALGRCTAFHRETLFPFLLVFGFFFTTTSGLVNEVV
jgi:hypothetical protein